MNTRVKTNHRGVYYRQVRGEGNKALEKAYYVVYRKDERVIEEKVGRQYADGMTPGKAAKLRSEIIENIRLSRKNIIEQQKAQIASGTGIGTDLRIKRLEDELANRKMAEEKLVFFTASATEGFILFDSKLNLIEINDSGVLKFPGTTKEELLTKNLSEIVVMVGATNEYEKLREKFMDVLKTGENLIVPDFIPPVTTYGDKHLSLKAFKVGDGLCIISSDITESKQRERELKKSEEELKKKTQDLEEINIALRVLLKKREEDRAELEEKVLFNIKELVEPYLEKMKNSKLDERLKAYLDVIESNLNDIIAPFARTVSIKFLRLTNTEIKIANLVKQGRTSKEIATILSLSPNTIVSYRKSIRKKLKITNEKANLRTHLLSIG